MKDIVRFVGMFVAIFLSPALFYLTAKTSLNVHSYALVGTGVLAVANLIALGCMVQEISLCRENERKIRRLNDELHEKVAELQRTNQQAQAANLAKDNFLANLSHELRTPLTPVLALLGAWEHDHLPVPLLDDVRVMRRNVELQTRLIDDLLDITRIVSGKVVFNRQPTDLHELLGAVAGVCESELRDKRIVFRMQLESARHHVDADSARLQQVFWNIVKNAAKFTPPGGAVNVRTSLGDDGAVRVAITDTGIGMTADVLGRLFRSFEQGTAEIVCRFGGLGLGMAISKSLIEAHGGTLIAESDGPGLGSTFTVCIATVDAPPPRGNESAVRADPAPSPPYAGERAGERGKLSTLRAGSIFGVSPLTPTLSPEYGGEGAKCQSSPPLHAGAAPPLNILLVEDHADTAHSMARLLKGIGYQVTIAYSVAGATMALNGGGVDLLLCDIRLPDGTGIDVVRQMRQRHDIPAIAMTGLSLESDIARCKEAGFIRHVTKPVDFHHLETILASLR